MIKLFRADCRVEVSPMFGKCMYQHIPLKLFASRTIAFVRERGDFVGTASLCLLTEYCIE
jgi:hypothetical protein